MTAAFAAGRLLVGLGAWKRVAPGMLLLTAALSGACGGRAMTIEGAGGDSAAVGGVGAQGNASAGSGNSGGSTNCMTVNCPDIGCAPGTMAVMAPGACCATCNPLCNMACPSISCASGSHIATPPGQCCATCVLDPAAQACADGQKAYASLFDATIMKYQSLPCHVSADCTVVDLINDCETACGIVAVPSSQGTPVVFTLNQAASMDCATCGAGSDVSSCPSPPPPACQNGKCAVLGRPIPR